MSNELIRELVEVLNRSADFLPMDGPFYSDAQETLAKARAYLESGGWTKVEDGLPVVSHNAVEIYTWAKGDKRAIKWWFFKNDQDDIAALKACTHWRYAEQTPEPPKG